MVMCKSHILPRNDKYRSLLIQILASMPRISVLLPSAKSLRSWRLVAKDFFFDLLCGTCHGVAPTLSLVRVYVSFCIHWGLPLGPFLQTWEDPGTLKSLTENGVAFTQNLHTFSHMLSIVSGV